MMDISEVLLQWFCKRFDKIFSIRKETGVNSDAVSDNQQLA